MDPVVNGENANGRKELARKRRRLTVIKLIQDFAKNTSLHGLSYTTEKDISVAEKLFWIVTFLVSISLCAMLIHNVWVKWQTSPVIVALSEQLLSVGEVPFPSVTICPQIKAKRTVFNFTREAIVMKTMMMSDLRSQDEILQDPYINKFEDVGLICWIETMIPFGRRNYSDAAAVQNILEVSPDIDDVFRGCRWRDRLVRCSEWFSPVLTMEGVCFAMNSLASSEIFRQNTIQKDYFYLNSSKPSKDWSLSDGYTNITDDVYPINGRGNGYYADLMLILKEKPIDRDGLCHGINRGYKIFLQHSADMPQSSVYHYAALPGQSSSFALKFTVMNTSDSLRNYHPETRQCYYPEERHLRYFSSYTPMNCRLECVSQYTFENCGCVWFHMPHNDSTTICRELKRRCVLESLEKYAVEEGRTDSVAGRCKCLPSCVDIQYEAEIFKTDFDIKSYLNAAKDLYPEWYLNDTFDNEGELFTQLQFYYKEPRFVSIRRSELFGLTDFLANCGGLLGLFLGFSFLSLVEIVYFLTLRFGCSLRRDMKIHEHCIKK